MSVVTDFLNLPFGTHLVIGTIIRLFLILYGQFHDEMYAVPYTDVDYRVFTDAARHVLNDESPYRRHTYRYSPILAFLMTPNILLNSNFGKILFSLVDILVGIAIKKLVCESKMLSVPSGESVNLKILIKTASQSALFWIYNPLSIVIATRGNADTLASFLVIMSLLFHETNVTEGLKKYFISGVFLGIAIHFRIYPIVFSLPMFIALGEYKINRRTNILSDLYQLIPNWKQFNLVAGCVSSLGGLTAFCYWLYGYEFLFETYIYHIIRKDTRHNFSLFFYLQYLTADDKTQYWFKAVPLMLLIVYFGLRYGRMKTLNFALFAQAIVLVVYNSVVTSQYFVWFVSLIPLCIADFNMSKKRAFLLCCLWAGTQACWLYFAYQLEFKGKNVFFQIWCAGVAFYGANLYILNNLIRNYKPSAVYEIKQD
ncbi:phosphatidylinositol glycan anchor biosynthesis class M [Arctopsyche grandis]|uniref:phosphatidylinositol glycan anchor biosynthesis class M n=1 Tax=Arctopsyche grandis TaxID=121162 RepID=UPI00406D8E7D